MALHAESGGSLRKAINNIDMIDKAKRQAARVGVDVQCLTNLVAASP